jgi:hypothetical protein
MMGVTTDPTDPRLTRGVDEQPVAQADVYLVLSQEERAKGFVRPYRDAYKHVGLQPAKYPLRDLTDEERERHGKYGYVKYEKYPDPNPDGSSVIGRFWTQKDIDNKGCGNVTTMGRALSETYARDPTFYGGTYCCTCRMHRPVGEFVWTADGTTVGS